MGSPEGSTLQAEALLRLNAAITAAVTRGFAEMEIDWSRQSRDRIEALIAGTDLDAQMHMMGLWEAWPPRRP